MLSPPETRTRRAAPLLALLVVLLSSIVLTACGGDEGPQTGDGPSATATRFPVNVEHRFGTTEIPAAPRRVVAVGYNDADFALALGQSPLAIRAPLGQYAIAQRPWAAQQSSGEPAQVIAAEQIDFEQVAAQRPDLILAVYSGITPDEYETLSQIAPTVAQTDAFVDFGTPWQEQTRLTGQALGQAPRAEQIVRDVERQISEVRRTNRAFEGTTVAVTAPSDQGYFVNASEDLRVRFFTDLGFVVPSEVDRLADGAFFADISRERVELLDQDLIVVLATRESVADDELFQRLDAVREGRVIYLPPGERNDLYGALAIFNSPLSLPFQLEQFTPRLEAALDGDPATEVPEAP